MSTHVPRRQFLRSALASGAFTIIPRHVLGAGGYVAPSEKITLAHIGMGTQGFSELGGLLADPAIQIVAVCDPNTDSNNYVEWGKNSIRNKIRSYIGDSSWGEDRKGCPGGRELGRQTIDAYYANNRAADNFKACTAYEDFRELLENEKDLDAVKVMTPDHLHATVSIAAMKKGKHVLMHKPLANRLHEGRLVIQTARQTQRATHLLAYGSGKDNGRICAHIKQGIIGRLREIHNWTNRPVWPQYNEIPSDKPPVPKGFNWDLWLGPETDRPYHPHYTHAVFRGWYDFGGGSMADMGIYSLWPVFAALNLKTPVSAHAWATHTCAINDNVSRPVKNNFSYPTACNLRFHFAKTDTLGELDLFWYDGGMKPRLPEYVEAQHPQMAIEGILFVGDKGSIMGGFHGQNPCLFTKGRNEPLTLDDDTENATGQRHNPWIDAVKGGDASPGSFLAAAAITDTVNLGTVALRAGEKVVFDSDNMKITNADSANKYLRRQYRPGWEL